MLAERSPDEQSDVGPTLASNVGPTELTTLSQRWPNVVMLSGAAVMNEDPQWKRGTRQRNENSKTCSVLNIAYSLMIDFNRFVISFTVQ